MLEWLTGQVPAGETGPVLLIAGLFLLIYFTLWFLLTERLRNAGLVDIGWGMGFVLMALVSAGVAPSVPGVLLAVPVGAWGIRLAVHIGRRNIGKPEDPRYQGFRLAWGKGWRLRAWLQLFLFQGVMMGLIALPYLLGIRAAAALDPAGPGRIVLFVAGLLVWVAGFGLETTADAQLARFLRERKGSGRVLDTGVWAWSRHPNYFGEALAWWGVYLAALAAGAPGWTAVGPLAITLLVRYVSGVPMLEQRMAGRPEYAAYARRTPVFIPRPPVRRKET